MQKMHIPHMTLGGTSFLLHADYVRGTRFTAERCDDVELLLLQTGKKDEYLPTVREIHEIASILDGEHAQVHVHLPTDADFSTEYSALQMAEKARMAVACTAELHPHHYILHMDFAGEPDLAAEQSTWTEAALHSIAECMPHPNMLLLENLPGYPFSWTKKWMQRSGCLCCPDVGHIWKDGNDPLAEMQESLYNSPVVHLHGIRKDGRVRDHVSLQYMPAAAIDAVLHYLWDHPVDRCLVLDLFTFADFAASHAMILQSWNRYTEKKAAEEQHAGLTLFLGGIRSGKSEAAENYAWEQQKPVLYIATAEVLPNDPEMLLRIRQHRARRPATWQTLEIPMHLAEKTAAVLHAFSQNTRPVILLDCVTLWIANILGSLETPENMPALESAVRQEVCSLLNLIEHSGCMWILVSSETGMGGIAGDRQSRNYCDALGLANQLLAAHAREVWLVIAGKKLELK